MIFLFFVSFVGKLFLSLASGKLYCGYNLVALWKAEIVVLFLLHSHWVPFNEENDSKKTAGQKKQVFVLTEHFMITVNDPGAEKSVCYISSTHPNDPSE